MSDFIQRAQGRLYKANTIVSTTTEFLFIQQPPKFQILLHEPCFAVKKERYFEVGGGVMINNGKRKISKRHNVL